MPDFDTGHKDANMHRMLELRGRSNLGGTVSVAVRLSGQKVPSDDQVALALARFLGERCAGNRQRLESLIRQVRCQVELDLKLEPSALL